MSFITTTKYAICPVCNKEVRINKEDRFDFHGCRNSKGLLGDNWNVRLEVKAYYEYEEIATAMRTLGWATADDVDRVMAVLRNRSRMATIIPEPDPDPTDLEETHGVSEEE